jgi:hypothetical protein
MNTEILAQSSDKADIDENVLSIVRLKYYSQTKSLGTEWEGSTPLAPLDTILSQLHPPHISKP